MRTVLLAALTIVVPRFAFAQTIASRPAPPLWRERADIAFGLASQAGQVPDGGPTQELAPALDITLGVDRRVHRFFRVAFGMAHVFPVTRDIAFSHTQHWPVAGETSFYWRLALMPSAAIEFAPVSWWSLAVGARAGIGFGNASVVLAPYPLMSRDEMGAWPVVHAFAQTAFSLPTRPSFGLGARAAAGWSVAPEILLELLLTAAY